MSGPPGIPPRITRRPARPEDAPFLLQVYAGSRDRELAQVPWDEATKAIFLRQQFAAQARAYQAQFPDAEDAVLECDGSPVGRLQLARRTGAILILDLALLPERRGRGLGSAVLQTLMAEAAAAALPLQVHVADGNPALHLYRRLGFRPVAREGWHDLLQWDPPGA